MFNLFKILSLASLLFLMMPAQADIDHFWDNPYAAIDPYDYVYDNYDNYFDDYFYNSLDYYYCPYRCCWVSKPCRDHDFYGYFERGGDGRTIYYRGGSYSGVTRGY